MKKNLLLALALATSTSVTHTTDVEKKLTAQESKKLDAEMLAYVHATIQHGTKNKGPYQQDTYDVLFADNNKVTVYVSKDKKNICADVKGPLTDNTKPMEKELDKFRAGQIKTKWLLLLPYTVTVLKTDGDITHCYKNYNTKTFSCHFTAPVDPQTTKLLEQRESIAEQFKKTFTVSSPQKNSWTESQWQDLLQLTQLG
jgi:hypothetical protein